MMIDSVQVTVHLKTRREIGMFITKERTDIATFTGIAAFCRSSGCLASQNGKNQLHGARMNKMRTNAGKIIARIEYRSSRCIPNPRLRDVKGPLTRTGSMSLDSADVPQSSG
jgi:hypothetical protein